MRKNLILGIVLAGGMSLGACTTYDQYGYERNRQVERAAGGAAIGAGTGAVVGAVVDGVSPIEGAAAGAVVGAVVGAVTDKNRRWYRDNYGRCYYVDSRGNRIYDVDQRC